MNAHHDPSNPDQAGDWYANQPDDEPSTVPAPSDEALEAAIAAAKWAGVDGPLPRRVEIILAAAEPFIRAEERAATLRKVEAWLRDLLEPPGNCVTVNLDGFAAHFNPEAE